MEAVMTMPVERAGRAAAPAVGTVLADLHEAWIQHVAHVLRPILDEHADFWSRWAGVRFLADEFSDHFRLECRLLDALGSEMPAEAAGALAAAQTGIERTAVALMAAGRRRGTRQLTARLARRLVDQLALWCVEVELATAQVADADLPPAARALLSRLRVAVAAGR
jgi:hypothetical protein